MDLGNHYAIKPYAPVSYQTEIRCCPGSRLPPHDVCFISITFIPGWFSSQALISPSRCAEILDLPKYRPHLENIFTFIFTPYFRHEDLKAQSSIFISHRVLVHNYRLAFLSLFSAFFSFAVLAGAFLIAFLESWPFPIFHSLLFSWIYKKLLNNVCPPNINYPTSIFIRLAVGN